MALNVNPATNAPPAPTPSAGGASPATPQAQSPDPSERAAWTRYTHIVELSPTQLLISTGFGYSLTQVNSSTSTSKDGYMSWKTPGGNFLQVYDDPDGGDHIDLFSNNEWNGTFKALYFTGQTYEFYGRSTWKQDIKGDMTIKGGANYTRTVEDDFTSTTNGDESRTVENDYTLTVTGNKSETSEDWSVSAMTAELKATTITISGTTVMISGGGHSITVSAAGIIFA